MAEKEPVATFWVDEDGKFRVRVYPAIAGLIITVALGIMRGLGYI